MDNKPEFNEKEYIGLANDRLLALRKEIDEEKKEKEIKRCYSIKLERGIERKIGSGKLLKLNELIKLIIKNAKKSGKQEKYNEFWIEKWNNAVGPEVAEVTEKVKYSNGILEVSVNNFIEKNELENFHKIDILEKIRKKYPDVVVRDLKFKISALAKKKQCIGKE